MKKEKTIKILLGYFKPAYLIKSDIFVPVHLGRMVANEITRSGAITSEAAQWMKENMIGDDTGDNISGLNRSLCEVTGQYWAWKNYEALGNPDYIGFMQYRRQFIFTPEKIKDLDKHKHDIGYPSIRFFNPTPDLLNNLGLTDNVIRKYMTHYDIILPKISNLGLIGVTSLRNDFVDHIEGTHIEDFDTMHALVKQKHPELTDVIEEQTSTPFKYMYMMYIVPKEVFFDYMEFVFPILFDLQKQIDTTGYSVNGKRTVGYLAELLCDCYFKKIKKEGKWKIKELDITLFDNQLTQEEIQQKTDSVHKRFFTYLKYKAMAKVLRGRRGRKYTEKYKALRQERKFIKQLKKGQ